MFYILLDFIQTQEELTTLKGSTAKGSTNAGENAELRKKIKVLQAELETVQSDADRDLCEYLEILRAKRVLPASGAGAVIL